MTKEVDDLLWRLYVRDNNIIPLKNNRVACGKLSNNDSYISNSRRAVFTDLISDECSMTNSQLNCCDNFNFTPDYGILGSIDKNTKVKVDKGRYNIDGFLDLHGCNLDDAYTFVIDFVIENYIAGNRCLLIVTGYGVKGSKRGVLRDEFHNWLKNYKVVNLILYYTQATRKHGGRGAFYVLLRSNRKK